MPKEKIIQLAPLDAVVADSVEQYCNRTDTSTSRFYEQVKSGQIRVVKSGRRTLVPRAEILRQLALLEAQLDPVETDQRDQAFAKLDQVRQKPQPDRHLAGNEISRGAA